jgi:hypothetical protein
MRSKRKEDWSSIPTKEAIKRAHAAAFRFKRKQLGQPEEPTPFSNCKVWGAVSQDYGPVSGSDDMTETRRNSDYSKWELLPISSLRKEAQDHYAQMDRVSQYKMDGNKLDDLVCVRHELTSNSQR